MYMYMYVGIPVALHDYLCLAILGCFDVCECFGLLNVNSVHAYYYSFLIDRCHQERKAQKGWV